MGAAPAPSFIVETGSVVANANSYATVAYVDQYHSDRGNTRWFLVDTIGKQGCIVRATSYIDKRFGRRFRGFRQTLDQFLQWPRLSAFDDSGYLLGGTGQLPLQLQRACAEYALRAAIYQVLSPDPLLPGPAQDLTQNPATRDTDAPTGPLMRKTVSVGGVSQEVQYETPAMSLSRRMGTEGNRSVQSALVNDFSIPEYPEADMWLEEIIMVSNVAGKIVRGD